MGMGLGWGGVGWGWGEGRGRGRGCVFWGFGGGCYCRIIVFFFVKGWPIVFFFLFWFLIFDIFPRGR